MATLFRKILVPHDFSDHATGALKVAAELAARHRGRLLVLNVVPPISPMTPLQPAPEVPWVPPMEMVTADRQRLERLVARTVGRRKVRTVVRVEVGDPFERILHASRGVDSIVMATAGRTGLAHLVIGSVAEKVVRHSPVPVLTVRPPALRAVTRRRRSGGRRARRAARRRPRR
jgi:nucleotide-binding universal stress UspA family protein